MTENERIAIAARLHVALRRKTGRVTDTEWMASNVAYATAMVRFAREQAAEQKDASLAEIAGQLEQAMEPLAAAQRVHDAIRQSRLSASGPLARFMGGPR